jgi:hypothetical protein
MRQLLTLFTLICAVKIAQADPMPQDRLSQFPVPSGETLLHDKDFDQQPDLAFIDSHADLWWADPFLMERNQHKPLPPHVFEYFLSDTKPPALYLFYKRYWNQQSKLDEGKRDKPFYNARSEQSFDVEDEGDAAAKPDTAKAVFYTLHLNGPHQEHLDISIFNKGEGGKTIVYLTAYDEAP